MNMQQKIKLNTFFKSQKLTTDVMLDALTKTINRKYMVDYISYLISKKTPFCIAIVDVDNFKSVNDKYGHLFGDKVLAKLSDIISDSLPEASYIGRYGGDEFIILFENVADYNEEWANLKSTISIIRNNMVVETDEGEKVQPTVTIGATSYPKDGATYKELFEKADVALYRGKAKGRNCFIAYVEAKHKNLTMEIDISLPAKLQALDLQFKGEDDPYLEIYNALKYACEVLNVDGGTVFLNGVEAPLFYSQARSITKMNKELIESRMKDGLIIVNEASKLDAMDSLRYYIRDNELRSMLVIKIKVFNRDFGYLFLYKEKIRIWQENDVSYGVHLAALIGATIAINN